MSRSLVAGLTLGLLLSACEPPPVIPTADRRQQGANSRIEGEILVSARSRGNVVLFLFDVNRPPPPQGTGRPVAFTFIPANAIFGASLEDTAHAGPFVAPFAFSQVPAGTYLIRGFLDAYGGTTSPERTPDFIPWYGVTSEVNRGDVGGAYVDPLTRAFRTVTLAEDAEGRLQPVSGVTVTFQESALTVVPVDRPAFEVVTDSATFSPQLGNLETNKVVQLNVAPLRAGVIDQREPAFLFRYQDENLDGVVDQLNGVPQLWPRVIVRKLADEANPALLVDQNDRDRNGILDPDGFVDYPHLDLSTGTPVAADGQPDLVVLAAGWHPAQVAAQLNDSGGVPLTEPDPTRPGFTRFVTVPMTSLQLVLGSSAGPLALDASNPLAPSPLAVIPPGLYAIILIQQTGQTWRLPNELNPPVASELNLPSDFPSQGFVLTVTPQ